VCLYDKLNVGPAAYRRYLQNQIDGLSGTRSPDLSALNAQDRSSIESVCLYDKLNVGPAGYHRCLQNQIDGLSGSRSPDLSALNAQDQSSIESPTISHLASQASPDLQRLSYFVGTWAVTGQIVSNSFGVVGKLTGQYRNHWSTDGLSLVSDWNEQRPASTERGQSTYEYDPELKAYVCHSVDSSGEKETSVGSVEGQTWTWLSSHTTADGNLGGRFTVKQESEVRYTFKFESQSAAGEWELAIEGSASKKP
jgi:hypothetical protein